MTLQENTALELSQLIRDMATEMEQITEQVAAEKIRPDKWSKKEILGHLIDSAQNNLRRLVMIQYANDVEVSYNQDEWVKIMNYQSTPWKDIITQWTLANEQMVRVMEQFPTRKLEKIIRVGSQSCTASFVMTDYISHLKHHRAQIL